MRIVNKAVVDDFRLSSHRCEWCGKPGAQEVHHVQAAGQGGGKRIDIRINLFSLGSAFGCNCHGKWHDGNLGKPYLPREQVVVVILERIARREKVSVDWIADEIRRINALPKEAPRCPNHGKRAYAGYPLAKIDVYANDHDDFVFYCPECQRLGVTT